MGGSKKYWFSHVQKTIRQYKRLGDSRQDRIARDAIDKVLSDTANMTYGDLRIRFIRMVYFRNSHTIEGASYVVHVSYSTAKRWSWDFVNAVAHEMGYE